MKDYYAILGISSGATSGQIKVAYRRLALRFHPDRNKELPDDHFIEIAEAYHVLSDPHRRKLYDLGQYIHDTDEVDLKPPPRRPPPHFYYQQATQKPVYSRKVYILSSVLVTLLVIAAVAIPVFLLRATSNKHYNLALQNYADQRYYTALQNIDLSIRDVGGNNASACALASVILVYNIGNFRHAMRYIENGLGYTTDDSLRSELIYLKGICKAQDLKKDEALQLYSTVGDYSSTYDSARLRMAAIYLHKGQTALAERLLDTLEWRNPSHWAAHYLRGIASEQRGDSEKAFDLFSDLLDKPYNQAAVYYHLARAEINLQMTDSACSHLKKASALNLQEADQLITLFCQSDDFWMSPYD